jgi:tetratricopeptide (TPR) repeat protein
MIEKTKMPSIFSRRLPAFWLIGAMVLVPAAVGVGWWCYWPTYHRNHLLTITEKALAADNLQEAKESLEKVLKVNAGQRWEPGQEAHFHFLCAQVLRRLGQRNDASQHLLTAMEQGLPEPEGRREYALLEAADNFPLALNALQRVLEDFPRDSEILQALAEGYAKISRWSDAEKSYTRWLEVQPDRIDILLGRGHALMEAGRLDQAADDFRAILTKSPNHFQARLSLAQCLLNDFKVAEAEAELDRCHAMLPARSEPLVGLAFCAMEGGDLDKAQVLAKKALALDSTSASAWTALGILHLRRQRYDLAVPAFETVVRLNPSDKQGHLNLAQALTKKGDLEKAKQHETIYRQLDQNQSSGPNRNR